MTNPACAECGKPVEDQRLCYATPVCYTCLPPPPPLPELVIVTREQRRAWLLAGLSSCCGAPLTEPTKRTGCVRIFCTKCNAPGPLLNYGASR